MKQFKNPKKLIWIGQHDTLTVLLQHFFRLVYVKLAEKRKFMKTLKVKNEKNLFFAFASLSLDIWLEAGKLIQDIFNIGRVPFTINVLIIGIGLIMVWFSGFGLPIPKLVW
jgi:transposase